MTDLNRTAQEIRERFDSAVLIHEAELGVLFRSVDFIVSKDDFALVREAASWTIAELSKAAENLMSEINVSNLNLQKEVLLADRGLAASVDLIESTISHGVRSLRTRVSELSINSTRVSQLETFREEKQRIRFLLSHAQSMVDVLEIPQLVDQSIASENFLEGVSLLDFLNEISRKVKLFDILPCVADQAKQAREGLIGALEGILSTRNLKVNEINNLLLVYRMIHPKVDLKEKYIAFRKNFYEVRKRKIVTVSDSFASKILKDYTQLVRMDLWEISTQFKVLFESQDLDARIVQFAVKEVTEYLEYFQKMLSKVTSFESIAEIYRNVSLMESTIPLNTRMEYIFNRHVGMLVEKQIKDSLDIFKVELGQYNWRPSLALINSADPDPESSASIIQLSRNRPLAILYNDATSLLNDLRIFPLLSLQSEVQEKLDDFFFRCLQLVVNIVNDPTGESLLMRKSFCSILVPSIEKYIGIVFEMKSIFKRVRNHPQYISIDP